MAESEVTLAEKPNKTDDAFGLMFRLGEEGIYIIPLEFTKGAYVKSVKQIRRINQRSFSPKVDFVNYVVEDSVIFTDPLAANYVHEHGEELPDDLFFKVVEDKELLSRVVNKLYDEYKETLH